MKPSRVSAPSLPVVLAASLLLFPLSLSSPAQAGPPVLTIDGDYCIDGSGDGTNWWWRILDFTSGTPVLIGTNPSGTPLSVSGTTLQVATAFRNSIAGNTITPPFLTAAATLGAPPCGATEVKLELMFNAGTEWVLEVSNTSSTGPWATVGSLPVPFNPTIRQVPEPGAAALLAAGVAAVAALRRFDRRTRA